MSVAINRRLFLETAALGLLAACGDNKGPSVAQTEPTAPASVDPSTLPKLSIVTWQTPQEDKEAIREEARRLTTEALNALGGMSRFISRGDVVFIKPNIGWDRRPEQAANTNPDVVATLVKLCYEAGARKVRISDLTCMDEQRTFARSGIQEAAKAEGAEVFFLDRRKFKEMNLGGKTLPTWPIYTEFVECDKRINVPIAKTHNHALLTLSIKNLMGMMGDPRNQLHQNLGPALADVAAFLKTDLIVLDAIRILKRNGPTGGDPKDVERKDTIVAGVDPVAIDAFGATLFDLKPEDLSTVTESEKRGVGTKDYESLKPIRLSIS